jgi:isopenicillin N synthase-like dioxygenase
MNENRAFVSLPVGGLDGDTEESLCRSMDKYGAVLWALHGAGSSRLQELVRCARVFFDSPASVKSRYQAADASDWTGYLGPGTTGPEGHGDDFERVAIGAEHTVGQLSPHMIRLGEDQPEFFLHFVDTMNEMMNLCREINAAIARIIGFDVNESARLWFAEHTSKLVINHYPASAPVPLAAHTDFGGLSIVNAPDDPAALEIQDPVSRSWCAVRNLDASRVLVTLGELYSYWLDRNWPPSVHRVARPRSGRIAVVLFHLPRRDQELLTVGRRLPALSVDAFLSNREEGYQVT